MRGTDNEAANADADVDVDVDDTKIEVDDEDDDDDAVGFDVDVDVGFDIDVDDVNAAAVTTEGNSLAGATTTGAKFCEEVDEDIETPPGEGGT